MRVTSHRLTRHLVSCQHFFLVLTVPVVLPALRYFDVEFVFVLLFFLLRVLVILRVAPQEEQWDVSV